MKDESHENSNDEDDGRVSAKESEPKTPKKYKAWDKEEMMMLREGVQRHGVGSWETIRQDPDFHLLKLRTGVQIKDKWRNLVKYRHLTEEEKVAVANRTNKLHRHRSTAKSSSFTSGSISVDTSWAKDPELVRQMHNNAALSVMQDLQGENKAQSIQGLSAYQKAQQERVSAEAEYKQAQAVYDQASLQLNSTVADTGMTEMAGNALVDGLVATANHAMRNLVLGKHRLNLARDIETRLLKTVQFQKPPPDNAVATTCSSGPPPSEFDQKPMQMIAGLKQIQTVQNASFFQLQRSQSYDAHTFPPFYPMDELDPSGEAGNGGYSGFQGSLALPIPSPAPIQVGNSGTRSPRRSAGSLPCSPLKKGRAQGPGRSSMLHRSFHLPDEGTNQSLQHNLLFSSLGMPAGNNVNVFPDGGAACSASSANSMFMLDRETSPTSLDGRMSQPLDLPNMDQAGRNFIAPNSASASTTPHASNRNPFFGDSQSFHPMISDMAEPSFMSSCPELPNLASIQGGAYSMDMLQPAKQDTDMKSPAPNNTLQASFLGFGSFDMDASDCLIGGL